MNKVKTKKVECAHAFNGWRWVGEMHNDTDVYERTCDDCKYVESHTGKMPPKGFKEPLKATRLLRGKHVLLCRIAEVIGSRAFGSQVVYIAGKVSGLPPAEVHFKFHKKQLELEKQGFTVLNPCQYIPINADWQLAMRAASTLLMMSDHIYLLPDWSDSPGAKMEFELAVKTGINVMNAA